MTTRCCELVQRVVKSMRLVQQRCHDAFSSRSLLQTAVARDHDPDLTRSSAPEALDARSHELLAQAAGPCSVTKRKILHAEVILLNRRVCGGIAARYQQRGVDAEDLRQIAEMGLVKAVNRYEPDRGSRFLAFAVPTIRGEIRRYFRDHGWMVRPPRRIQELRGEVVTTENDMVQQLGRFPTATETAVHMGLTMRELFEVRGARGCYRTASLDAPARADSDLPVKELLGGPDEAFEQVDNHESLTPLLAEFDARDRLILSLRFVDGCTQKEIGDQIGVSQMQVSRLLNAILARLRDGLRSD